MNIQPNNIKNDKTTNDKTTNLVSNKVIEESDSINNRIYLEIKEKKPKKELNILKLAENALIFQKLIQKYLYPLILITLDEVHQNEQ